MRIGFISPFPSAASEPAASPDRPVAPRWPGAAEVRSLEGLSGEYRARVHQMNVRVREAGAREYGGYLEAYLEGARRCRTADELRAYGPPANADPGLEPCATSSEDADLQHAYGLQLYELGRANRELADLILDLERRPVPLRVFFDAALTAKVELGGRSYGGAVSARGGATPQVGAGGVTVEPGRVELGADAGVAGVKAAFARGRLESVEVSVRAAPGVRAFAKQSRGAIEQGVALGGKAGGKDGGPALHLEARASAVVTTLTPEVARWALSNKSFWTGEK